MKEAEMGIPHLFRCPISLDLLTDPVTLSTGQTYDRSSIEKWLNLGNQTCPVTMQKLQDSSMVPNHTLRHLIDQWLQTGHQTNNNHNRIIDPDPSIVALKHNLESHVSTLGIKIQTLETIQVLSDELPSRKSCLIQLGFFPLLLELLFGEAQGEFSQENLEFLEKALVCALKLIPHCNLRPLNILKEESKLEHFLVLFNQGTITVKKSLCQIVEAISSSLETEELCAVFGKNQTLLQGMVFLFDQNNLGTSEFGIKAVSALCSLESNRGNLVREGVAERLITYIMTAERHQRNVAPTAMTVVELLLGLESGKKAVIDHPNGLNALVKMVFRVSDHEGSESAVNALMILCSDSVQVREGVVCAGVLTQLLLLLQSQCSGRIKTKARRLLKLLRSMWHEDSTHYV